jgi:hypothetical protein
MKALTTFTDPGIIPKAPFLEHIKKNIKEET